MFYINGGLTSRSFEHAQLVAEVIIVMLSG